MNTATISRPRASLTRPWLLNSRVGWVGIDVGTAAIKVAQVEQVGADWRLVSARVIPLPADRPCKDSSLSDGLISSLVQPIIRRDFGFRGRRVACSLPMTVTGLQSFDLPPGTDAELRQMIEQEFISSGDEAGEAREVAFWRTPASGNERSDHGPVTVLSLPTAVARSVGEDLLQAKLHCEVLDGLPFALARAVHMISRDEQDRPQAAIDWGLTSPLLTIVANGRPLFARALRDRGLKQVLEAMAKRLSLSEVECRQLLMAYGQARGRGPQPSQLGEVLAQVTMQPLHEFSKEIQKTLQFLKQQHGHLMPNRIWLFGGGATFHNAADHVAAATGIETRIWQLQPRGSASSGPVDPLQAVLGPALALSALGVTPS